MTIFDLTASIADSREACFMDCFKVHKSPGKPAPILLSIPHCGTAFPKELINEYEPELYKEQDDTDWFVDQLYDFANAMGITTISAVYSRWVIDLNRHPENRDLYSDGRLITGLCPVTNFLGNAIYKDGRKSIAEDEIQRRLAAYYLPYHQKIAEHLMALKERFGQVLLWDCHSIRKSLPALHKEPFSDLIISDADGQSSAAKLSDTAFLHLSSSTYSVKRNYPFKGGYITRHFGKPKENQHAIQLEMSKNVYMDDLEKTYVDKKAQKIQTLLKSTLEKLCDILN
jgi:N-formylglutamate deformylase